MLHPNSDVIYAGMVKEELGALHTLCQAGLVRAWQGSAGHSDPRPGAQLRGEVCAGSGEHGGDRGRGTVEHLLSLLTPFCFSSSLLLFSPFTFPILYYLPPAGADHA